MLSLTVWMNHPSFYQSDVFRSLVSSGEIDLEVIFAKDLTQERVNLGWQNDLVGFNYRFLDKRNKVADAILVARRQPDRFHIINGFWTELAFAAALVTLTLSKTGFAIYSEAPDPAVPRSIAKRIGQACFGKFMARKAVGALSISHLATEFYRKLGVPEHAIYPFGYFRSYPTFQSISGQRNRNRIEVVFVGQLIQRKGLDLLLAAMRPLFADFPELHLTVIGSGELLVRLRGEVDALNLCSRVEFIGVIPQDRIRERIARADLLTLPSRWDGWGVVVNEALSVGVPVIVSDRCGASDLVRQGFNGYVFRSGDVTDLRARLIEFLNRRIEWPRFRAESKAVGHQISSEQVTPYLIKCLKHITGVEKERPCPPWTPDQAGSGLIG